MKRVVLAFGTRPEAIKMAPVYLAMREHGKLEPLVFLTGQHRVQLEQALEVFGVPVAANLDVMEERQSLHDLASRVIAGTGSVLRELGADFVLVHGDTLTTFAVAWSAFLCSVPVGHVEAGLRSGSLREPFPEEANRLLTDSICDVFLAPTREAGDNLLREGKCPEKVFVTGQTGVDAVRFASKRGRLPDGVPWDRPVVTVTLHRRENWGSLGDICRALLNVAVDNPGYHFVYPVHLNPVVREAVFPVFRGVENFQLIEPLEYSQMAALLGRSRLIVTDSGGLQEEGPSLGVPVLVVRNVTERPEVLDSGMGRLVGTDPVEIQRQVGELLRDEEALDRMSSGVNPFGDGKASVRIAEILDRLLN